MGVDNKMIQVKNISYHFLAKQKVLDDISLNIDKKEIVGVIGPNGAGKSTLLKIMAGVLVPVKGEVLLDQEKVWDIDSVEMAKKVAYVQSLIPPKFNFKVEDVVAMGRFPYLGRLGLMSASDLAYIESNIRKLQLENLKGKGFYQLSSGEQQRVMLARAFVQQTDYILLDEPLEHLDMAHKKLVVDVVRTAVKGGLGAVVVSHDINVMLQVADRIILMKEGRVISDGRPADVITEESLKELFNVDVDIKDGFVSLRLA